jgi:hypothetical protein
LRFIDDAFPLIIIISDPVFDIKEVRAMTDGFERYFARGERYAVLSTSPRDAAVPAAFERKLIGDWANHPRVRDFSKRLCVGSGMVVHNTMSRAALSIIMAIWRPPSPFEIVPSFDRALDYCLRRIREEQLPTTKPLDLVRYEMLALFKDTV